MENPQSWNLLTSSLAVSKLDDPGRAWAFLVVQGLVHDRDGDRATFAALVRDVHDEGPITGPSEAARIAIRLLQAGLTTHSAEQSDAGGKIAHQRAETLASWRS